METKADILLQLITVALGNDVSVNLPSNIDWVELMDYAETQGVYCIAFDGLQKVLANPLIDKSSVIGLVELLEWAGQTNRAEVAYKNYIHPLC